MNMSIFKIQNPLFSVLYKINGSQRFSCARVHGEKKATSGVYEVDLHTGLRRKIERKIAPRLYFLDICGTELLLFV